MSLQIGRLDFGSTRNGTFEVIAAIPTTTVSNGHIEWIVTCYDMARREYATWRMGWTYYDEGESTRTFSKCFTSGNYFNAREEALLDMVTRADLLPTINGTANLDIPPHKLQPMAGWEVSLLWPDKYASGIYYLTQGQMLTIYDMIRTGKKIQAIKEWRFAAGTKVENGLSRSVMGLLEAKNAVEAVKAHFENIMPGLEWWLTACRA